MADYITTYTGLHIDPTNPDINLIQIEDIAHALPLICRGNGHVKTFFSVGQHCLKCAKEARLRGFSTRIVLAALLHDASECYLSDVPRPFKKSMPEYVKLEEYLLNVIYEKFLGSTLTAEEGRIIKQIDDDLLYYDLIYLLGENVSRETFPNPPVLQVENNYDFVPFELVEKEYLEMFKCLCKK